MPLVHPEHCMSPTKGTALLLTNKHQTPAFCILRRECCAVCSCRMPGCEGWLGGMDLLLTPLRPVHPPVTRKIKNLMGLPHFEFDIKAITEFAFLCYVVIFSQVLIYQQFISRTFWILQEKRHSGHCPLLPVWLTQLDITAACASKKLLFPVSCPVCLLFTLNHSRNFITSMLCFSFFCQEAEKQTRVRA